MRRLGKMKWALFAAVAVAALFLPSNLPAAGSDEIRVRVLPLEGGPEESRAELSGLAWHGDTLVLMPQFPDRFPSARGGSVFTLARADIERYIARGGAALVAGTMPFEAPGLAETLDGFEGFEAIAFDGDRVFATVECEEHGVTRGYLLAGEVLPGETGIVLDVERKVALTAQTDIENLGYEAITIIGGEVVSFYEANGASNTSPHVEVFDTGLEPRAPRPLDHIEYRLTDVTEPDAAGRVWVTNYFYDGDCWETGSCPLSQRFGVGRSHRGRRTVERLVELEVTEHGVHPTDTAPIQLELEENGGRNWEGIARLGDEGFLIVTDEHPASMLGFVPR